MNKNAEKTFEMIVPWVFGCVFAVVAIFIITIWIFVLKSIIKGIRYNKAKRQVYENINEETVDEFSKKLSRV